MKTVISVLALLFLLQLQAIGQNNKEIVYIRIQENISYSAAASFQNYASYMVMSFPDGKSKTVDLERLKTAGGKADENGKIIQRELQALLNEGYEIISTAMGGDFNISYTTMILSRPKLVKGSD